MDADETCKQTILDQPMPGPTRSPSLIAVQNRITSLYLHWKQAAGQCPPWVTLSFLVFATVVGWSWINTRLPFPYIFADETGFMIPARAIAEPDFHPDGGGIAYALRSQSPVHSLLFSIAFDSGDAFFAHAKLLNCLLTGLMVIPAWLLARRVLTPGPALAFATLVAVNPWNSLSAHFMPESLYGCIFWWLAWAVLASLAEDEECWWRRPLIAALACGALGGLLFFTKPHALTVIAACAGVFTLRSFRAALARSSRWWLGAVQALAFSFVFYACLAGFAAVAHRTLNSVLFAGRYESQAGGMFSLAKLNLQLEGMWRQTSGHLAHAAVLYGVPMAVGLCVLYCAVRRKSTEEERFSDTTAFAALVFSLTLGVAVKFACDIMLTVDPNEIHRLAERYYGFHLPLLALPLLSAPVRAFGWKSRTLAAIVALGSGILLATQRDWYQIHPHDSPQYYWLCRATDEGKPLAWFVVGALVVATIHALYFVIAKRYDWRAFFITALFVCLAAGTRTEQRKWIDSRTAIHFHAFSQMTRQVIDNDWRHTIVIGDPGMVTTYYFYLGGLPQMVILPPNAPLPFERVPEGTRWIIRVRQHPLPADLKTESVFHYEGNGLFDIARILP